MKNGGDMTRCAWLSRVPVVVCALVFLNQACGQANYMTTSCATFLFDEAHAERGVVMLRLRAHSEIGDGVDTAMKNLTARLVLAESVSFRRTSNGSVQIRLHNIVADEIPYYPIRGELESDGVSHMSTGDIYTIPASSEIRVNGTLIRAQEALLRYPDGIGVREN